MSGPKATSKVRANIAANFGGQLWTALMGFMFVPLYIKFMGIESYGLVGFCASLMALFTILDLGLSTTMVRETARLVATPGKEQNLRDLLRTLEVIFWATAIGIAVIVAAAAPWIARHWIKSEKLSGIQVQEAVVVMGVALACRWPSALYSGGLRGLQRQVLLNWIAGAAATARGLGAVLILWLVSPTIIAFLLWQIVTDLFQSVVSGLVLWRALPSASLKATFRAEILRGLWRFTLGLSGSSILYLLVTQADKVILSKMLTLEMFGYYSLATVTAAALLKLVAPIQAALFPRLSELHSLGDYKALAGVYHRSCQLVTVSIVPAAIVLALFSKQILLAWTGDPVTSEQTALILSILSMGTALNGVMFLPYALQVSYGRVSLSLISNAVSLAFIVPLVIFLTERHGASGAAAAWVLINVGGFLIIIQVMHRMLLKGQQWQWYSLDVGLPSLAALVVALALGQAMPEDLPRPLTLVTVGAIWLGSAAGSLLAARALRVGIADWVVRLRAHMRQQPSTEK
ncbi:MAG: polysaccharide biosynthesis protein [Deltaproteobacteria bacterium]|nr:polysaccharide biosynthesis protein [Deltaproteobacteria bacterium]